MQPQETSVSRLLEPPDRSFFLFGPRGVGKSTWLKQVFPDATHLDLLDASLFLELTRDPHRIEALVGPKPAGAWIVIDEIQKAPPLLEEAHRLMEARRWRFVLCGSSARKLRRSGVNLLGGRAVTRHMEGFSAAELKDSGDLQTAIEWGCLPLVVRDTPNAAAAARGAGGAVTTGVATGRAAGVAAVITVAVAEAVAVTTRAGVVVSLLLSPLARGTSSERLMLSRR